MRVVVLGAGYGGLSAALQLESLLRLEGDHHIVLIDQNNYHQLKTRFYSVATEIIGFEGASVPIEKITEGKRITFLHTRVKNIDFAQKTVSTEKGEAEYDKLIIALGSQTEFFGIPGLREHALGLLSLDDALHIRDRIRKMFAMAKNERDADFRRTILTFVIGGGGSNGTGLAGELADWMLKLTDEYEILRSEVRIILIEATESILPGFDLGLISEAVHALKAKGVELTLGKPIIRVDENVIQLKSDNKIPAQTMIWTGGIRANDLLAKIGLTCGVRGRVIVNPYLESVDHAGVYIIGDCALILDPRTGRPLAPTAQLALQQAQLAAKNIYAEIKGRKRQRYIPKIQGIIIPLGQREAVGYVGKFRITGSLAWFLKQIIDLRYLYSIGGIKLVVWKLLMILR